jgi:hypothetical protein
MDAESLDTLTTSALNALASSPNGSMTLADIVTHLETRFGPNEEEAQDATAPQSRSFRQSIERLVSTGEPQSLIARGLASAADGVVHITEAGRALVGR